MVSHSIYRRHLSKKRNKKTMSCVCIRDDNLNSALRGLYRVLSSPEPCEIGEEYVWLSVDTRDGCSHGQRSDHVDFLSQFQGAEKFSLFVRARRSKILLQVREIFCSRALAETNDILAIPEAGCVLASDDQRPAAVSVLLQQGFFIITNDPHVRNDQSAALERRQCSRGHHLKLEMFLHQQDQNATIGRDELIGIVISRARGEINA